ncbi:MAG: L,D-transpeptidase [Nitrospirae bacterium]|nr:L,D-transpeptidase [Nitrospirota bacterium]
MQLRFIQGIASTFLLICLISILNGCKTAPAPPEVVIADTQEHDLWRAGAEIYFPKEYKEYKATLRSGKDHFIKEQSRFAWFRDYEAIQKEFSVILSKGNYLFNNIQEHKRIKTAAIASQIVFYQNKIDTLKKLTSVVNEGRVSRRQLIAAELLLGEVQRLAEKGKYQDAERKLKVIPVYTTSATEAISPVLNRYADKEQITKWRSWVHDTIAVSKEKGICSIFVSKLDRKLVLYKNGVPHKTYSIGLGKNGFHDKLHAGDLATPEGKYYVTKKQSRSKYFKALLINYPNEEDLRQFARAKKKGLIPARVGVGSLIEIHGGGTEGMTYGCIAMDNSQMDELYNLVDVGTPVTIVGSIDFDNVISSTIKDL